MKYLFTIIFITLSFILITKTYANNYVAKVYETFITETDITPKNNNELSADILAHLITTKLLNKFIDTHHISVSADEIKQLVSQGFDQETAKNAILSWKAQQLLYQIYGGKVYQTRELGWMQYPLDAITAYYKQEIDQGNVKFFDPFYQQAFLKIITSTSGWGSVPPEKVNMTKPWWERSRE